MKSILNGFIELVPFFAGGFVIGVVSMLLVGVLFGV